VEGLYVNQHTHLTQTEIQLQETYNIGPNFINAARSGRANTKELGEIIASYTELCEEYQTLQWFGHVNSEGFSRIFRKIESVRLSSTGQNSDVLRQFGESRFANQEQCSEDLERIAGLTTELLRAEDTVAHSSMEFSCLLGKSGLPSGAAQAAYVAIIADDDSALDSALHELQSARHDTNESYPSVLGSIFRYASSRASRKCIDSLISYIQILGGLLSIDGKDWAHHLIMDFAPCPKVKIGDHYLPRREASADCDCQCGDLMSFVFNRVEPQEWHLIATKDSLGRLPLHYAARYGFIHVCTIYLNLLAAHSSLIHLTPTDAILLQDSASRTPLQLGVIAGKATVTKALLNLSSRQEGDSGGMAPTERLQAALNGLLPIAIKLGFLDVVQVLLDNGADPSHSDLRGQSSLYVAAQSGQDICLRMLLLRLSGSTLALNSAEFLQGWTPLIVACANGHSAVVDLLLRAGALAQAADRYTWTAHVHAAFRGHLHIARKLGTSEPRAGSAPTIATHNNDTQKSSDAGSENLPEGCQVESVKRSTHNCEIQKPHTISTSRLLVTLGSPNTRDKGKAVDIVPRLHSNNAFAHPEQGHSVEVLALDAKVLKIHPVIHLPLLEDINYEPWHFTTGDPRHVKLVFNIYRSSNRMSGNSSIIGSGVVLLRNLNHGLASNRESLARYHTTSILEKDTLRFMGTVTFGILIVTPHPHPEISPSATTGFWCKQGPTQVVGHRGDQQWPAQPVAC